jgi:serine protease Do
MALRSTRRGFILAAGGAVGLAAVGSAVGDQHDDVAVPEGCDVDAARRDLESVEGDLAELRESLAALQVEVVRAHADGQPPSDFPADVRERALETGLAARPQVVMLDIRSAETEGGGTATGWFIEDGYVVTNAHNVDHDVGGLAGEILCHLPDGRTFEATVVDYVQEKPPEPDVAVLGTDYDGPGMPLGTSEDLSPDQPLVQVGHPGGFGNWVVALGAFEDRLGGSFTSTVPGLEGNSGSPVMTLNGDVVGMLSASVSESSHSEAAPRVSDVRVQQGLLVHELISEHVFVEIIAEKLEAWT